MENGAAMILAARPGFHLPEVTELFSFRPFMTFSVGGIMFDVTFPVVLLFALSFLVSAIFVAAFRSPSVVPSGLQNGVEAAVDALRENVVLPTIGPDGDRWMPFLVSLFFFVLPLNYMGIVPLVQFPISSRIAIPAFLALISCLIFNAVGIRTQGFVGYFRGMLFPPGVPKWVYALLTPIEFFSTIVVRPLTLAIRLMANMMAGHVMLTILFLATGYFLYRGDRMLAVLAPFSFGLALFVFVLEVLIAFIQAFIFTILTAVYIGGALHPEH